MEINNKDIYKKRAITYMFFMDALILGVVLFTMMMYRNEDSSFGVSSAFAFVVVFSSFFYISLQNLLKKEYPHAREYTKSEITNRWSFTFSTILVVVMNVVSWLSPGTKIDLNTVGVFIATITLLNGFLFLIGKIIASFIAPDGYFPWKSSAEKTQYLIKREKIEKAAREIVKRQNENKNNW